MGAGSAKRLQKSEAIVTAARQLLREGGVSAVTHRTVAARAGVSLASTTYYFTTIDDIFAHAIRNDLAAFRRRLDEVNERTVGQDPVQRVIELVRLEFGSLPRFASDFDVYLAALVKDPLKPLAREWRQAVVDIYGTAAPGLPVDAVVALTEGYGIKVALLGADALPALAEIEEQVVALLRVHE